MSNPIEILVNLGINEKTSEPDLNKQIEVLSEKLEGLKVDLKIDQKAIDSLDKLSKIDLGKLNAFIDNTEKGISGIGKGAQQSSEEATASFQSMQSTVDSVFAHMGENLRSSFKRGVEGVDELKSAFEGLNPKFEFDTENVRNATGEMEKIAKTATVEYTNLQGQIEKVNLVAREFMALDGSGMKPLWQPVAEDIKVIDSTMRNMEGATRKAHEELGKLHSSGRITTEQFKELSNSLNNIAHPNSINLYNQRLKETVENNKRVNNELKEQERIQERIRKLINSIVAQQGKDPKNFGNNSEVQSMLSTLEKIDPASKGAADAVNKVSHNFDEMKATATAAGRESMTFMDSFRVAMEKFPVWMAASTAFYGTVRTIKSALTEIIELDSQLTVLRRVAGDGVDVNKVLAESVELAKQLGNEISDINEGFIAFARQGFRDEDLTRMSEYATLLGNISELNVEDAASVLTAGMKGFNIEAEESIRIVDALNEVDNNYSVTTLQLAEAMQRSAGSAQVYGIELEKNIGYTTAIAQVTRESGSVIGNSLKSIYSRITSIQPAIDAMADIGINVKTSAGEMRDVSDILDDLGGKWHTLSAEQQQNLGLQIAGKHTCQPIQKWIVNNVLNSGKLWRQTTVSQAS